jgi:hypothetical protein
VGCRKIHELDLGENRLEDSGGLLTILARLPELEVRAAVGLERSILAHTTGLWVARNTAGPNVTLVRFATFASLCTRAVGSVVVHRSCTALAEPVSENS